MALELARRTGMVPTFSAAISFDGGGYGVGLLSRERPVAVHRYPLPGREERRTLLVAEFKDYTVCCTHLSLTEEDCVASAEIICNVAKKLKHKPIFLMGDFNAETNSQQLKLLTRSHHLIDRTAKLQPGTYKYQGEWSILDHILTHTTTLSHQQTRILTLPFLLEKDSPNGGEKPKRTYLGPAYKGGISDHLPVVATFQIK